MTSILALPSAWREGWRPASFKNAVFHCEVNTRESGRRIVEHEFPKKELPYAEDMGRRAKAFNVRGYIIQFPYDTDSNPLQRRDYRRARDALRDKLEEEGGGILILPFARDPEWVVCAAYRLTEEERFGGFCTFDMTFIEGGLDPQQLAPTDDTQGQLMNAASNLQQQSIQNLSPQEIPD